jgi:N-ethylmaleimide reductase
MKNDIIFSPLQIKNVTFPNRLGVAPMTRMSSTEGSIPRQDVLDFLVRRAEGGVGLVYTEAIVTDYESSQGYPGQARMLNQLQIDAWAPVVEKIRAAGAVSIMQIFHCGRMSWPEINPVNRIIAPSALPPNQQNPLTNTPYPVPEAMSLFDIEHVKSGFVETAKGAMAAGFDGIEIHGAHGYLINQFLSNYSNTRNDLYGGSVENRFRFARDIIQSVRKVVPSNRLLSFRISNWGVADMDVSLFDSCDEWQQIIRLLSEQPLDALSISTYAFGDNAFGTNKNMAQLTKEVTSLPIIICGKIFDRKSVNAALQHADIALSGKSLLLNPNWVEDIRSGKKLPLYESEDANIAYTDTPLQ